MSDRLTGAMTNPKRTLGAPAGCDELRELLPAYIAGALSSEDIRRTQALLDDCLGTRVALDDYVALTDAFSNQIEPVQPPAELHDRLMRSLSTKKTPLPGPVTASQNGTGASGAVKVAFAGWMVALILGLLLAGTGIAWANQRADDERQLQDARAYWGDSDGTKELARLRQERQDMVHRLGEAEVQRVILTGTGVASSGTRVTLLWQPGNSALLLVSDTLPAVGPDKTYQLWLMKPDETMSAGVFEVDEAGITAFTAQLDEPVDAYESVAITVEPAGGSSTPSGTPLVGAQLAADNF